MRSPKVSGTILGVSIIRNITIIVTIIITIIITVIISIIITIIMTIIFWGLHGASISSNDQVCRPPGPHVLTA